MFENLPSRRVGDELVRYHQDPDGQVITQPYSTKTGKAFSIDFVDSTGSFQNARAVADVSMVDKAGELKAVTDSNLLIAGARVSFLDGANAGRSATTNAAGEFYFDGLVAGNANLSVTAPGYLEARAGLFVNRQAGPQFLLAPTAPAPTA